MKWGGPARLIVGAGRYAGWAGLALVPVFLWAAFVYAPEEAVQGPIQRIFYIHVPVALNSFLAFGWAGVAGGAYLFTRDRGWDATGQAAAEVGLVYGALVLITGPLWAKPVWGVWWTWDARLTSMLILWLTFVAYAVVRSANGGERGARVASILAIAGALNIPFVRFATERFRTLHPGNVVKAGLDERMHAGVLIGVAMMGLWGLWFTGRRILIEMHREACAELEAMD